MKMIRDQRRSTRKGFVPSSIFQSFEFLDFVPETQERGRSTRDRKLQTELDGPWCLFRIRLRPVAFGRSSFEKI